MEENEEKMEDLTHKKHRNTPRINLNLILILGVIGFLIIGGFFLLKNIQPDTIINYGGNNIEQETQTSYLGEAVWGASVNFVETIAYWDFDESSGIAEDLVDGLANGTRINNPTNILGVVENGTYSDGDDGWDWDQLTLPNHFNLNDSTTNASMNFWFNYTHLEAGAQLWGTDGGLIQISSGVISVTLNGLTKTSTFAPNGNQTYMLTLARNETNSTALDIYVDGVFNETLGLPGFFDLQTLMNTGNTTALIYRSGSDNEVTGWIDELGFWNDTLSTTQITNLYNSGSGLAYDVGEASASISSPADNTEDLGNITISGTAEIIVAATLTNISLWTNESGSFELRDVTLVTGTTNTTVFNYTFNSTGKYIFSLQGCDSDGDCGFADNRTISIVRLKQLSESFVTSTTSGIINPFVLSMRTNGTPITVAYLNYNGVDFIGTINSTGNNYTLSRNITATGVETISNISFFWNITLSDGFNSLTDSQNQTVSPIIINGTCDGMTSIMNFTMHDEVDKTKINETDKNTTIKIDLKLYTEDRNTLITNYSDEFNRINPVAICIDDDLSGGETYSLDVQVQYNANNYSSEFYNIERYVLNSSTLFQNISLYDLDDANAQNFRLFVRDTSFLPIDGALIQIERKYIENGTFFISEIPKTDENGITSASLQLNDVVYNFKIFDAGTLVETFTNVLAICQTPLVTPCEIDFSAFQSEVEVPDFEESDDFNFTLEFNQSSRIVRSVFIIPSGNPSTVELVVTREDALGTAVCSDTLTSAAGTLTCTVPSSFGNSTVNAKLFKDSIEIGKGNLKLDQKSSDIFGVTLVILSVLVMITLIGVGVSDSPVVTGIFLFVGVVLIFALNLSQSNGFIGATASILFLAIAIILVIIKAARRS